MRPLALVRFWADFRLRVAAPLSAEREAWAVEAVPSISAPVCEVERLEHRKHSVVPRPYRQRPALLRIRHPTASIGRLLLRRNGSLNLLLEPMTWR